LCQHVEYVDVHDAGLFVQFEVFAFVRLHSPSLQSSDRDWMEALRLTIDYGTSRKNLSHQRLFQVRWPMGGVAEVG
jgi:hypothetical protein